MQYFNIEILRQRGPEAAKAWESFTYEYDEGAGRQNVAGVLRTLPDIRWECGCLQKKCGACAMVINGKPSLACDAWLDKIKDKNIRIEPLRKFPVVQDLIVDRSAVFENLRRMGLYLKEKAGVKEELYNEAYESSRCMQCGICLEVCPNFHIDGVFLGMAALVPASRLYTLDKGMGDFDKEISRHIYEGCGKSLSCRDVCPAGIDIEALMVNTYAAAVWKRGRRA